MPLGDSITEAGDGAASYRYWLWHALQAEGYDVDFVGSRAGVYGGEPRFSDFDADHEGHWGWTTGEVLGRIEGWAEDARPDVVLLHLGTNDLGAPIEGTLANLAAIVRALRRHGPNTTVLLAELIPVLGFERVVRELNDELPALVARLDSESSRVVLVDQWTGFHANTDTSDGIHPDESGEKKMAERWLAALRPVLEASQARSPAHQATARRTPAVRGLSK